MYRYAPRPPRGTGGARGGATYILKGISSEQEFWQDSIIADREISHASPEKLLTKCVVQFLRNAAKRLIIPLPSAAVPEYMTMEYRAFGLPLPEEKEFYRI